MTDTRVTNKVALVTGANSGVGLELTKKLLVEGFEVVALTRSDFPVDDVTIIQAVESSRLRKYRCDFSDFESLKRKLQEIKSKEGKIDVLFNNAGVSLGDYQYTPQQREIHYEVNVVVPYIILRELTDLLRKGELKTVVNTSSNALLFVKKFDPTTLAKRTDKFVALFGAYAESKLALSLWTEAISTELAADGIEIRSVCPGPNQTPMTGSSAMPWWLGWAVNIFFLHPRVGGGRIYNAAFKPKLQGKSGVFVNVDKVESFKFGEHKEAVLKDLSRIYEEEFLKKE